MKVIAIFVLLYIQHEPLVPVHCLLCQRTQVESINLPNIIGPGIVPNARKKSQAKPTPKARRDSGMILQNIRNIFFFALTILKLQWYTQAHSATPQQ